MSSIFEFVFNIISFHSLLPTYKNQFFMHVVIFTSVEHSKVCIYEVSNFLFKL